MSSQIASTVLSIMKLGKDIVPSDLIQLLLFPDTYGKIIAAAERAGIISEGIYIVHVYNDPTVDLQKTAILF